VSDATADAEGSPDEAADEVDDGPELDHGVPVSSSRGQRVLHPDREQYLEVASQLRDEGFVMCLDVCGVDYLTAKDGRRLPDGVRPERFEVVANLINHRTRERVRLRVQVPESDPSCPSLWPLYAGVENPERECFDLFGITFVGHPDMTRILMPETWQGHPLRKDYAVGQIPVQFKGAPSS
jgi:NADH-quinone oxidoreductase subunit C